MRCYHDRTSPLANCIDQIDNVALPFRVESGRWFIDQEQFRLTEQRLRKTDTLHHPARESAHLPVDDAGQTTRLDLLANSPAQRRACKSAEPSQVEEILTHGVMRMIAQPFRHISNTTIDLLQVLIAENTNDATVRAQKASQQMDQGCLPCAVRTQYPVDDAARHVQRHTAQYRYAVV